MLVHKVLTLFCHGHKKNLIGNKGNNRFLNGLTRKGMLVSHFKEKNSLHESYMKSEGILFQFHSYLIISFFFPFTPHFK
jgi:hypothetical protein